MPKTEEGAIFRVRLNTGFTVLKALHFTLGNPEAQIWSLKFLSVGGKTIYD